MAIFIDIIQAIVEQKNLKRKCNRWYRGGICSNDDSVGPARVLLITPFHLIHYQVNIMWVI